MATSITQSLELIEVFCVAQTFLIKPWFQVSPEIQYIVDTGGTGQVPDK